jgi:hypothetical protein
LICYLARSSHVDPTLCNLLTSYLEGEEDAAGPLRDWLLERGEERAADMVVPESLAAAGSLLAVSTLLCFELVRRRLVSHTDEARALAPWLNQARAAREVKKLLRQATGQDWSVRTYETGFVVTKPARYWRRGRTCQVPLVTLEEQELMTVLLRKPCLPYMATVCGETAALRRELILRLRAACAREGSPSTPSSRRRRR